MANLIAGSQVNCKLVYNEQDGTLVSFKSKKAINDFVFALGGQLRYTGYAKSRDLKFGVKTVS